MKFKNGFLALLTALCLFSGNTAFSMTFEESIDNAMGNISTDTNIGEFYTNNIGKIGDSTNILKDTGSKILTTNWSKSWFNYSSYAGEVKANTGYDMWLAPAEQLHSKLSAKGVTSGADVHNAIAQSLGMNTTSSNDMILELWVTTDKNTLLRPTLNPINNVLPKSGTLTNSDLNILAKSGANSWETFVTTDTNTLAANMVPAIKANALAAGETWSDTQALDYATWLVGQAKWAYGSNPKTNGAPWSGLGYTYDWSASSNSLTGGIQGLSEYIIKSGNTNFEIGAIYSAQSYIYRATNPDPNDSTTWNNGDFNITGDLNTLWAGRKFQPNGDSITVTPTGSIANGEGVLVSSLGYTLDNQGSITMSDNTLKKFGIAGSEDTTVLFLGNTSSAPNQNNVIDNSGTIGNSLITNAIVATGDTDIDNSGDITGNIKVVSGDIDLDSTNGTIDGSILAQSGDIDLSDTTLLLRGDNSGFTGSFDQQGGTTTVFGKFFGGTNSVGLDSTLIFLEGASPSSAINVTQSEIDIWETADTPFTQDVLTSGIFDYKGQTITMDNATLGLFNGTKLNFDVTLKPDTQEISSLAFGNGSGIEGNITLNDITSPNPKLSKVSFYDGAYTKAGKNISLDLNSIVSFENKNTLDFNQDIISRTTYDGRVVQSGAGTVNLHGDNSLFSGRLDIYQGNINFMGNSVFNTPDISAIVYSSKPSSITNNSSEKTFNIKNLYKTGGGTFNVLNNTQTGTTTNIQGDLIINNPSDITDDGGTVNIAADTVVIGSGTNDTKLISDSTTSANLNVQSKTATFNDVVMVDGVNSNLTSSGNTTFNRPVAVNSGAIALYGNTTINSLTANGNAKIDLVNNSADTILIGNTVLNSDVDLHIDADGNYAHDMLNTTAAAGGSGTLFTNGKAFKLKTLNFMSTPKDANFTLADIIKADNTVGDILIDTSEVSSLSTPIGNYALSADGNSIRAALNSYNNQVFRGQVATIAQYANQIYIDNMLFDHMDLVNQHDLIAEGQSANKYAAETPQFAPYQYNKEEGGVWMKSYGIFENIGMSEHFDVRNYAYGALLGVDLPQKDLGKGWKVLTTLYVAYNGGHQTYDGIGMYQNGGQGGIMGTFTKGNLITSLLAYGGGYGNRMNIDGVNSADETGNWFAGAASKTAYNFKLPWDLYLQPNFMVAYNIFGKQNWNTEYGAMSMSSGMLNGLNIAPGLNLIWNKKTFSIYATTQLIFNIMGGTDGWAGNVDLPSLRINNTYFEYGLGFRKTFKERFSAYFQATARAGARLGGAVQGGIEWRF